jgi:hypothetical protein
MTAPQFFLLLPQEGHAGDEIHEPLVVAPGTDERFGKVQVLGEGIDQEQRPQEPLGRMVLGEDPRQLMQALEVALEGVLGALRGMDAGCLLAGFIRVDQEAARGVLRIDVGAGGVIAETITGLNTVRVLMRPVFSSLRVNRRERRWPESISRIWCSMVSECTASPRVMTLMEDPEQALQLYLRRMRIEEQFRDLRNLLHLDKLMNKSRENMEKLSVMVYIAYAIGLLVGEKLRDRAYRGRAKNVEASRGCSCCSRGISASVRLKQAQIYHMIF